MSKYASGIYTPNNIEKYMGRKAIHYRSSWEYTFCAWCDNNPAIIAWSSEGLQIPYRNPVSGKNTIYVPDFLIVYVDANQKKHTELIEIKPSSQTTMENAKSYQDKLSVAINMAKWASASSWAAAQGIKFRVITEHDLYRNVKR